jgi:Bax protein
MIKIVILLLSSFVLLSALEIKSRLSVEDKKSKFKALVLPVIERVYNDLETQYNDTKELIKKGETNSTKVTTLIKAYSAESPTELLERLKPHAKSIALAQAAIESAWGTSRFFKEANNLFGIWSKNRYEERIPASRKRGSKTIYLKKYKTLYESVQDYYKLLATGKVYKKFRQVKMKSNNPFLLARELNGYSEIGYEYTKRVRAVIHHNKFYKVDNVKCKTKQ